MSKKRDIKPAETAPVYTGPVGLHPISETAYEVRAEGRQMDGGFIELFAHDAFEGCDMSGAVCRNFDESLAWHLKPGDAIGFSTPDGETAIPFRYTAASGWHFDPVQKRDIRTIKKVTKLYAPATEDPTPQP